MKVFTVIFTILATALILYNVTKISFSNTFESESLVALITIFAALCGILLVHILRIAKRIEKHNK